MGNHPLILVALAEVGCTAYYSLHPIYPVIKIKIIDISIMFYGPLSPLGPDFVELVAILKALEVFKAANWIGRAPLIVESDSKVILNWLLGSLQRPWRWWKIIRDIGCLVTQIGNI
ncbi:hypothetical protein GQ457_17G004680 [Hibiscus cannabinus]